LVDVQSRLTKAVVEKNEAATDTLSIQNWKFINTPTGLKCRSALAKEKIRSSGWNIEGKKVVDEFGVPKIIDSYSYDEKTDTYTRNTTKQTRDGKEIDVPDQKVATYLKTKQTFKKETDLTPEEKDQLEAINKKLSKPLALCVMRAIYVAKKENYNGMLI
jgi:hypothetical protein